MEAITTLTLLSEISEPGVVLQRAKDLSQKQFLTLLKSADALNDLTRKFEMLMERPAPKTICCNLWGNSEMPFYSVGAQGARILAEGLTALVLAAGGNAEICVNECDNGASETLAFAAEKLPIPIKISKLPNALACYQKNAMRNALKGCSPVTRVRRENDLSYEGGNSIVLYPEEVIAVYHLINGTFSNKADARLLAVIGDVCAGGIAQVSDRTTFQEILNLAGGLQEGKTVKYLHLGYPSGYLIAGDTLGKTLGEVTEPERMERYFPVLKVYDSTHCAVDALRKTADLLRRESCGCCVYCREGCKQMHAILEDLAAAKGTADDPGLLKLLAGAAIDGAICEFGRGAGRVMQGALDAFRPEIEAHLNRRCHAAVCKGFITYHILPRICNGCSECQKVCEQKAIAGSVGEIRVIDGYDCNKCGACLSACPVNGIVRAGAVKPRTPKEPIPVGSWTGR